MERKGVGLSGIGHSSHPLNRGKEAQNEGENFFLYLRIDMTFTLCVKIAITDSKSSWKAGKNVQAFDREECRGGLDSRLSLHYDDHLAYFGA